MRVTALGAALVAALALAAGCRGGDRADATADTAVAPLSTDTTTRADSGATTASADSATRRDSAATQVVAAPTLLVAVDSAIGDSLYHNSRGSCITCHGPRGSGNASLGPSLRDTVWLDTDGSVAGIAGIIRGGVAEPKGGSARMPAFGSQLDSLAVHRIAIYVYSLSHPGVIQRDSAAARAALPPSATDSIH
jgi:mono/diheme cytochrome c family protein